MIYRMNGVCSNALELEIEDGKITKLEIYGGCNGNLQGVSQLAIGQDAHEIAEKLSGIHCGSKSTSCPDQIAKAICDYLEQQNEN